MGGRHYDAHQVGSNVGGCSPGRLRKDLGGRHYDAHQVGSARVWGDGMTMITIFTIVPTVWLFPTVLYAVIALMIEEVVGEWCVDSCIRFYLRLLQSIASPSAMVFNARDVTADQLAMLYAECAEACTWFVNKLLKTMVTAAKQGKTHATLDDAQKEALEHFAMEVGSFWRSPRL